MRGDNKSEEIMNIKLCEKPPVHYSSSIASKNQKHEK